MKYKNCANKYAEWYRQKRKVTAQNIKTFKNLYRVGDMVKVKKSKVNRNDIESIKGTITGVYDSFIVVSNGRIRESFMYVDIVTGNVSVKEVGT